MNDISNFLINTVGGGILVSLLVSFITNKIVNKKTDELLKIINPAEYKKKKILTTDFEKCDYYYFEMLYVDVYKMFDNEKNIHAVQALFTIEEILFLYEKSQLYKKYPLKKIQKITKNKVKGVSKEELTRAYEKKESSREIKSSYPDKNFISKLIKHQGKRAIEIQLKHLPKSKSEFLKQDSKFSKFSSEYLNSFKQF